MRTIVVPNPHARSNVLEACGGAGAPVGIVGVRVDGERIEVTFDPQRTAPELIDALLTVETTFAPDALPAAGDLAHAIALAARGLAEPDLDATRIIETYLP